jgi:hypothetical protein
MGNISRSDSFTSKEAEAIGVRTEYLRYKDKKKCTLGRVLGIYKKPDQKLICPIRLSRA